jgi:hypothetical protein
LGAEHGSVCVDDCECAARCGHGRRRLGRGRDQIILLTDLVLHDVGQRRGQRLELVVDAPDAEALLLPQHGGAEQAQHHQQRQRVPQRQPAAQRQWRHGAPVAMTSW